MTKLWKKKKPGIKCTTHILNFNTKTLELP